MTIRILLDVMSHAAQELDRFRSFRRVEGYILFCLILFLSLTIALRAQRKFDVAPSPDWVQETTIQSLPSPDTEAANEGVVYLLVDQQENIAEKTTYYHYARKVVSPTGLQSESQLVFVFDPSFQRLVFHYIRIWRGGKVIDKLNPKRIQVIQRETSLEYNLYDGRLSALLVLDDLRIEDIIEYACSFRGENPVFNGHYASSFQLQWRVPLERLKYRLIVPNAKHVYIKSHNSDFTPTETHEDDKIAYLWDRSKINALIPDDEIPPWYNPFPWVQVTDFNSWQEVAKWAGGVFETSSQVSPTLQRKIDEIKRHSSSPDERVMEALRFIQDEIRYFGIELGTSSHKPTPPSKILAQRFGDCKDKSLLLCTMLQKMDIEAVPVLVNTYLRRTVEDLLPSAVAFDHVVVQVRLPQGSRFFDPTISNQGGDFEANSFPDYGKVLIVDKHIEQLVPVERPGVQSPSIEVADYFAIPSFTDDVELTVISTYRGAEADFMRSYFAANKLTDVEREYQKYYAKQYDRLIVRQPLEQVDDRIHNELKTTEHYTVPDVWVPSSDSMKLVGSFYGQILRDRLKKPSTVKRTMPLGLRHPINLKYDIEVDLPHPWGLSNSELRVNDKGFTFYSSREWSGSQLKMKYALQTLSDVMSASDVENHIRNIDLALEKIGYTLYEYRGQGAKYPVWFWALVGSVFVISAFAVKIAWQRSRLKASQVTEGTVSPELPLQQSEEYHNIRGWLLLPAFGVVSTPFSVLWQLWKDIFPVFTIGQWAAVTTPGMASYHPFYSVMLIVELLGNLLTVTFAVVLAIYLFRRKRETAKIFAAFWLFNLAFIVGDHVLTRLFITTNSSSSGEGAGTIVRTALICAVWIPYFFKSQRARRTFVN